MPKPGFGLDPEEFLSSKKISTAEVQPEEEIEITEEDIYLHKLEEEFGAQILFQAKKIIRGWAKMSARQQYDLLKEQKENAG
jgi:hypothetical protein